MSRLLVAVLFALSLGGCAVLDQPPLPVAKELSQPAQAAQTVINEAYVTLIAAGKVATQYVEEGWITKAEGRAYYVKLSDWHSKLAAAQSLLDAGDFMDAKTQASLISSAVVVLHNELAKRKAAQ